MNRSVLVKEAWKGTLGRGYSKDKGTEACKSGGALGASKLPSVGSQRH